MPLEGREREAITSADKLCRKGGVGVQLEGGGSEKRGDIQGEIFNAR